MESTAGTGTGSGRWWICYWWHMVPGYGTGQGTNRRGIYRLRISWNGSVSLTGLERAKREHGNQTCLVRDPIFHQSVSNCRPHQFKANPAILVFHANIVHTSISSKTLKPLPFSFFFEGSRLDRKKRAHSSRFFGNDFVLHHLFEEGKGSLTHRPHCVHPEVKAKENGRAKSLFKESANRVEFSTARRHRDRRSPKWRRRLIDSSPTVIKAFTYIPRKTFPATEEKIARYFDSIKKVPSSSALSSSSGSSKRKRGSDDEKTPRRSPNKYRPRRRRHGANIITSYVTSITNPRGEQQDEPSPSSTQSSHDPISSAQVTEDLPSRVTRSQGQAPAQMPLPPQRRIFKPKSTPARKEVILHPSRIPG
ncbi:hypothetical protein MRB53_036322 [Persea americana]|nr:hypothetical protein MRB53_042410 [Persea americana]KAJ8609164.1 hypothetical protein MRB53_039279 [Persea americana]KAJ8614753.1 hypothetical protein MRB53_036419 [Persea americana]KAJ8614909.1 hypothetical protein MRB53_036322 [Persea americana]